MCTVLQILRKNEKMAVIKENLLFYINPKN